MEKWKVIVGYPNYEVSSWGRVRKWGNLLNPTPTSSGYLTIRLAEGKSSRLIFVHVLVCSAFNGPRPSANHEVAHGNGNGHDNHKDNLRWATPSGNRRDAIVHGNIFALSRKQREILHSMKGKWKRGDATRLAAHWGVHRNTISRYYKKYVVDP